MHVSLGEHIYAGDDKWFLALAVGGCERERETEKDSEREREKKGDGKAEGRREN